MKIVPLQELTITSSNIPADTTTLWNIDSGYSLGNIRKYNDKLYEALGIIDPLCQYIYDNSDVAIPHMTTVANTMTEVGDNTVVPCTQNTTVTYDKVDNAYYLYTAVTGNVDFTNTDFSTDANWSVQTNYRHEINYPDNSILWFDNGYINEKRMLDTSTSSQTSHSSDIDISFTQTRINTIMFMNLDSTTTVRVVETEDNGAGAIIGDNTYETQTRKVSNLWEYFFNPFFRKKNIVVDVTLGVNIKYDITFAGTPSIGLVGAGLSEFLGGTKYGAKIGMTDYSKKITDSNGDWFLQEGKFARTNDLTLEVDTGNVDFVSERLDDLRATPILYNGSDGFSSMKVFGVYKDYSCVVSLPSKSIMTLSIEALT